MTGSSLVASRWLELHRQGLARVSAVVDGSGNYDDLLEYRLTDQDREQFGPDVSIEDKRERAGDHIRKRLLEKSHRIIVPQYRGFVCEGSTPNNEREYRFFERLCSRIGLKIRHQNYSSLAAIAAGKLSPEEREFLEAVTNSAQDFYQQRADISAGLVRQLTLYSVSFFRFAIAFSRPGAVLPHVLVQANDHSPVRVAMAMIMKGHGVPRIYLQHAEVTLAFPPLDFEYTVLRNNRSRGIYAQLGALEGQVFVLPRHEQPFARARIEQPLAPPVTVVIYPTSRVLVEELRATVQALLENPAIGRVAIKQHPAAARQLDDLFSGVAVEFVDAVPSEPHVALVGNSGIVTELLHAGIRVFQDFSFDPVTRDYYGFVRSRLTHEVDHAQLRGPFWQSFAVDEKWLETFKELDPSVDDEHKLSEKRFVDEMLRLQMSLPAVKSPRWTKGRFKAASLAIVKRSLVATVNASPTLSAPVLDFALSSSARLGGFLSHYSYLGANYLRNRTKISVSSGRWLESDSRSSSGANRRRADVTADMAVPLVEDTLRDLNDPAAWIARNERLGVFGDHVVIQALENMFQDRRPELSTIFEGFRSWPVGSAVGTWIYLKRAEWGLFPLAQDELERLSSYIHGMEASLPAARLLERALLAALIRCGTTSQLHAYWDQAKGTTPENIGTNLRIAVIQKLLAEPDGMAEAAAIRDRFEENSSPFERLKFRNMDYMSGQCSPGWSHEVAEDLFEKLAPGGVAREFRDIARPFYEQFRSSMTLMEVRTDSEQSHTILENVKSALTQQVPFSLVRLSDGEGYLFPEQPHFSEADARNRERHWWGGELPPDLAARIISEAQGAISSADVVGIPSVYRFIRDTADSSRAISQSLQGRGLLQVLAGLLAVLSGQTSLSEDKVNVSLFSDLAPLLDLAASGRRTILVGSVREDLVPEPLRRLPGFAVIPIPTHARTSGNERYVSAGLALPFVYDDVLRQLDDVGPGDLVLVAGGIIGKILLGHARRRGAVVLDIGSVIDDWLITGQKSLR